MASFSKHLKFSENSKDLILYSFSSYVFVLQQQVIALGYYFRSGYQKALRLNKREVVGINFGILEQEEFLLEK